MFSPPESARRPVNRGSVEDDQVTSFRDPTMGRDVDLQNNSDQKDIKRMLNDGVAPRF